MDSESIFSGASWIGAPETGDSTGNCGYGGIKTAYFRLMFSLAGPARLRLSISAYSRYRLWVNGRHVAYGPCKGDRWRHFYETVDIGPYLQAGENLIAVKVVAFPPYEAQRRDDYAPQWTMAKALGPCLVAAGECTDAQGESLCCLTTGRAAWEACPDEAVDWRFFPLSKWMGSMECVHGDRLPAGLTDDSDAPGGWRGAAAFWPAFDQNLSMFGIIPTFPLTPRPIPMQFEKAGKFLREMPLKPADVRAFTFQGFSPAEIPPHSRMAVELDAGEHMTAFLKIPFLGGRGSRVSVRYAEGYSRMEGGRSLKGRRDDCEHYDLIGHEDVYYPSGGKDTYEPFWFRTFRFIRIEAETGCDSLTVGVPSMAETGYPLEALSEVSSPEAWVGQLWDISVRTLRRCMHETYVDCPYYEQLQYIQDTRLEMLFTYMLSGDTRLALRAMEDFHCSLLPDGMLLARYPTQEPLVIPPFSLHWISMLEEYYGQTGDASVPRRYRPTVDAVLDWYDRKIGKYGLAENLGYWDQIDWVDQWDAIAGRTPAGAVGPATTHNLMYAVALQAAARINRITGREGVAQEYEERASSILENVGRYCWSETERMYMEGPGYEEYSQHAQVYAVLSGLAEGGKARDLLTRTLEKKDIAQCSFTQQFFLFRALEKCGAYELTGRQWDLWKVLLDKNLTTVPEVPDGKRSPRSDCHAWGALPLYEFTRCILGVKPGAPGWESIVIEPHTLTLPGANGRVTTPKGPVSVAWTNDENGFDIRVETPDGVPAELILPDGTRKPLS